ncbi:MAG TPA: ferredoxin [Acidimicrobiales bacterium]|nr:ferredoxin [Acidimicrobiales bacterium]
MRVVVDPLRCQGNGICARIAPEVFEVRAGAGAVTQDEPAPSLERAVRDAARRCPTRAVKLSA